jgi:hypothetical protein
MGSRDLSGLPAEVRESARVRGNGECEWRLSDAAAAINALAATGHVILGLDLRSYPDGQTFEAPWSSFEPAVTVDLDANVEKARQEALDALARANSPEWLSYAEWILISWQHRTVPLQGIRHLRVRAPRAP